MSFSATEGGFVWFLERSLALLRRERPDLHSALVRAGRSLAIRLSVDDESACVRFEPTDVSVRMGAAAGDVVVTSSSQAVLAAVDGTASLARLVHDGRLDVRGRLDDVLTFHDALTVYLHGAVRAPGFTELLRSFRGSRSSDPSASSTRTTNRARC